MFSFEGTCPASMARVFHEIGINQTSDLVNTLEKASRMVAKNASATEERAKRYLKDVKGFVKAIEGECHCLIAVTIVAQLLFFEFDSHSFV